MRFKAGLRHFRERCILGVLHHGHPTGLVDRPQPRRTVPETPGEHHADCPIAAAHRNGTQHWIDRRAGVVLTRPCPEPELFAIDKQMPARGCNVYATLLFDLTFVRECSR